MAFIRIEQLQGFGEAPLLGFREGRERVQELGREAE